MKTTNLQTKVSKDYDFTTFSHNTNQIHAIKLYNDGITINLGGSIYNVEHHDADIQIWRDKNGRIVSIDITYLS